jgi:NAD(P)-dependent dehydrogenase (short-subunit alcohol dehydrogenase family)
MNGQRIVVIGGTSGLGRATAEAAAAAGADLVIVSSSRAAVDRTVAALPKGTEGYAVDVTDEAAVRAFFDQVGAFDHLVYTAGEALLNTSLAALDITAARRFFEIRYFGALTAAKYAVPEIRPGGSIVLTSGIASTRPQGGTVVVSGVLAAIEGMTRALAVELAPIRVNAVVPSIIRTELWNTLDDPGALYESVADSLPLGRIGEPTDVAEAYLYLLHNKHTTGTLLTIDGGALLS